MKRTISIRKMEDRIRNSPKGTIFLTSDFTDLASSDAANRALLRLEEAGLILLIVQNADAMQLAATDRDTLTKYQNIRTRYKNMRVCLLVSCAENAPVSFSAPELLRNIKDLRQAVFFDDISRRFVCYRF